MKPQVTRVKDAAARLGIHKNQLYDAIKLGQIPAVRVGKLLLIPTAQLDKMLGISPRKTRRLKT